jgi:hypothetical protein
MEYIREEKLVAVYANAFTPCVYAMRLRQHVYAKGVYSKVTVFFEASHFVGML